jgi:cytidylate kinase
MSAPDAPVLIIGGPTASGKSALAVDLAEAWGGIVVSADAMTVYRGLDVGTAKPGAADRARAPHRCLDLREPHEDFNVADFLAEVDAALASRAPLYRACARLEVDSSSAFPSEIADLILRSLKYHDAHPPGAPGQGTSS